VRQLRERFLAEVGKAVVGQQEAAEHILVATVVGGHVLLEGVPGVAKTLLANAAARAMSLDFRRVQFTPDMLPSDLTGTITLRGGELAFRPGPVFANVVLADEINRTPPKTQAALLEAMQEGHVTVDGITHPLPEPFLVVATQNPIEYEGTYPLPEAQLDRFLVKVEVGYPGEEDERAMLSRPRRGVAPLGLDDIVEVLEPAVIAEARRLVDTTTASAEIEQYVSAIVRRTRDAPGVALGASPRAGVHLLAASRARARLADRDFVSPDDVATAAYPVLRHRLILRTEAEIERYRPDDVIRAVLAEVPVPR
jgi:MoxR-like ATPase